MIHRAPFLILFILLSIAARGAEGELPRALVPGFEVEELPVRLSNINNLRFSPEGRLTALGYDGRIHLLRDGDGDGLEDGSEIFWDEPTMIVPVGMCWSSGGLYVSSKGKVSFFPDADRNGKADREEVLTTNWPPVQTHSGNVDATGVTLDREGNLYFGLLTANYANAYQVKDGKAEYSLAGKRGTIQKYSVRSRALETVATGIRVPYQLAFNKAGDLFVSDQEGETWCPNGNPEDELNHVISGRNYGFPPRHPDHLPNLISEPPAVSFGPQHQSACGFVFNEPTAKQKLFGPTSWEGNIFLAGESRGKIYRVRMVKTRSGYLGKEQIFARVAMLVTDIAISPKGDMYVSCHSGEPDWGTGPKGEGKLFRIRFGQTEVAQPVAIWAAGPMQARIAFDKPLDPAVTNRTKDFKIEFGEYARAADRLEKLKPPYKTVHQQEQTPRGKLNVTSVSLSQDRRTLSLLTDPHPQSVHYAVSLPGLRAGDGNGSGGPIDLDYDLGGVDAVWSAADPKHGEWRGWLPHLDEKLIREMTIGSAEHEKLYTMLRREGRLVLNGKLKRVVGAGRLRLDCNLPFSVRLGETNARSVPETSTNHAVNLAWPEEWMSFRVEVETGKAVGPGFHAAYLLEDSIARPLPFSSLFVPWAPRRVAPGAIEEIKTELAGGDYERGRELFFNDQFRCSTCHRVRGEGATLGPDLSNLAHRDAASVLRDIREPNVMINPDYVAFHVGLADESEFTGFVRAENELALRLTDATGKETVVQRASVKKMEPGSVSLMPTGLLEGRKDSEVRDLLTYLLNTPPVRKEEEVDALLGAGQSANAQEARDLKIVLVANAQDHGPGQHDYPRWQTNMNRLLAGAEKVTVENAWEWPGAEQFARANAILFYYWNRAWTPEKFAQLDAFLGRGGGMLVFHSATISDQAPEELARRIGLAAQPSRVKYLHAPIILNFVEPEGHPITAGFSKLYLLDEPYWPMIGDTNTVQVLATAEQEGRQWPMIWTVERGEGRVYVSIPGHYTWTHDDPMIRILTARALAWVTREGGRRFEEMVRDFRGAASQ